MEKVSVIGAGLAGCEAAFQLASMGVKVDLYEQKPIRRSPAHKSDFFAELVCSNSFRASDISNAVGLLKEEMRLLNSLIIKCADESKVPAGGALAVDRDVFARKVSSEMKSNPNINVVSTEVGRELPDGFVIIATGPLTDGCFAETVADIVGEDYLFFFDAAAPIVYSDSIDFSKVYKASRYNKGGGDDYINCPMNEEQYDMFYSEIVNAECIVHKDFEENVFEACMPIEVMALRGRETMLFGPLKPVGLPKPDGSLPFAVVQLRQDNLTASLYNMVGFQTHLTFPEQKRVFSLIPGLEEAEFARYGVMHRNSYINSPKILGKNYKVSGRENIYFAGQITGVEGYVESAASGLLAGIDLGRRLNSMPQPDFGCDTAIGALSEYVSTYSGENFQPINVNFGIISPFNKKVKNKREKNLLIAKRAIDKINSMTSQC